MDGIYEKKYVVQVSETDFRQRLKLSSLFIYLQDMATEHANIIGVGRDILQKKYGVVWVLTRARVDIIRYPGYKEEISIETWPDQPGKVEFNRNFLVYDKDRNIIMRALTQWVIIDFKSRRLRRSSTLEEKFPQTERESAIDCNFKRIKAKGELALNYKKTVGYSDIDINEHLNNARYVDYIMDCFTVDNHKKHFVKSIDVNYLNEALPGETIALYTDTANLINNMVYVEGINENTGSKTFIAQITLE